MIRFHNRPWSHCAINAPVLIIALTIPTVAKAVVLVSTSDPGYYNSSIGTVLNDTNGGESGPFPVSEDGSHSFPTAPDLSAADAALGNWLTDPLHLNSNWTYDASIPNSWDVGTEVAVMYQFNTLGATGVSASFGVDNGIFVWLDGAYLGGNRDSGGVYLGEYVFPVGTLTSGTHFLQLLLEDHGSTNGYAVSITADSFTPGPPPTPSSVPEPSSLALLTISTLLLLHRRRATP